MKTRTRSRLRPEVEVSESGIATEERERERETVEKNTKRAGNGKTNGSNTIKAIDVLVDYWLFSNWRRYGEVNRRKQTVEGFRGMWEQNEDEDEDEEDEDEDEDGDEDEEKNEREEGWRRCIHLTSSAVCSSVVTRFFVRKTKMAAKDASKHKQAQE